MSTKLMKHIEHNLKDSSVKPKVNPKDFHINTCNMSKTVLNQIENTYEQSIQMSDSDTLFNSDD